MARLRNPARFAPVLLAAALTAPSAESAINATSYPFTSAAGVPLEDMSAGTTTLVPAFQDDLASVIANIGFDFFYDGVRYTQFSCNANGLCRLGYQAVAPDYDNASASVGFNTMADAPKVAPYFDDLFTGVTGKVHFKVVGAPPNRKLVVEWLNEMIPRSMGAGTFQMWLFETTGVVEFVYGTGVVANAENGGYSIGVQSGAATNFASVTSASDTVSYAAANNTQSNAIASGKAYVFTPPVPAAPTGLNFAGTTAAATTLNWTDNSASEVGFAIYKSTDGGSTFAFLGQAAANATSFADSGLVQGTTYHYRVFSLGEGALGGPAASSVTTTVAGSVSSTPAGGNWSSPATWLGGLVPTANDNVTIANGAAVVIDTAAVAYSVTVGQGASGSLLFEPTTARTLAVGNSVTIANGGTFASAATGTQTGHVLSVGGNLTNNGTLDFSTNANAAGATIAFRGASNATFAGTGPTTDIRQITVDKGTSSASILDLATANFTVQGATTDVAGWLAFPASNGTFKLSGTFTGTSRVFTTAAYTIGTTGGFWLNNPNYTVAGQNGSPTQNGLLRITQGAFNIGTAFGNSMGFATGSTTIVEGGTVNAAGRFGVAAPATEIHYT
ncbi:MAG TPA: hypothetical protein VGR00_15335, partial [Thermoanaerobaculia bacterium]|nr:hypothetical protein [Thermoanaerobaculia bacterium]